MGLMHTPPPLDSKVSHMGDDGVFRTATDERLTSVSHTRTEGVQREQSEPHQNTLDFSPLVSPLQNPADARGTRVSQALHPQQSGVADLLSSRKSDEVTTYVSDNDQSHADAYLSHLKKLESELERHVSRIRDGNLSFRKENAFRQGGRGSSITRDQVSNYRRNGGGVRESQTSRSQSRKIGNERSQFASFRNDVSRTRESVRDDSAGNEVKLRIQPTSLTQQTNTREGKVYHFQSGSFRKTDASKEAAAPIWVGSRVWRQQSQGRADEGRIRLRDDDRTQVQPARPSTIEVAAEKPRLRQHQEPEAWRSHALPRPPSPQGGVLALQSFRDEKTFLDMTAAPRASTTLVSPPLRAAPRRGLVGSARARQQFATPHTSTATFRAPLISREGQQRQVQPASRRPTNSYGHSSYTFQQIPAEGESKESLFREEEYYYSSSGHPERSRASQRTSSIYTKGAQTSASSRSRGSTSKTSSAGLTQAVRSEPDRRLRQQHRGDKNSFWDHIEGSYKPTVQRGSRKFVDTLRDMNEGMEKEALLRSLAALLRGEDFSAHWTTQETPQQGSQRSQDSLIPQTGESHQRVESRLHLNVLLIHALICAHPRLVHVFPSYY